MSYLETPIDYNMIGDGTRTISFVNVSVGVWNHRHPTLSSTILLVLQNAVEITSTH